jgi:hypothetical protein
VEAIPAVFFGIHAESEAVSSASRVAFFDMWRFGNSRSMPMVRVM